HAARLNEMNLTRTPGQQNCEHPRSASDVDHRRICRPMRQNEIRSRLEPLEHRIAHRRISEDICGIELIDTVRVEAGIVNVTAIATRDDVERPEAGLEAKRRRWTERMDRHSIYCKYRL